MADFSDDHLDKRVVAQSGAPIGTVTDVRDGDLYVTLEVDKTDNDAVEELQWDGPVNQEQYHLEDRYVSNITEHTIRLRV